MRDIVRVSRYLPFGSHSSITNDWEATRGHRQSGGITLIVFSKVAGEGFIVSAG